MENGVAIGLKIILIACVIALALYYGPPVLQWAARELPNVQAGVGLPFPSPLPPLQ